MEPLKRMEKYIAHNYNLALQKAVKHMKSLLREIDLIDKGKVQAPANVNPDKWRQERVNELMHTQGVARNIAGDLVDAGEKVTAQTKKFLRETYATEYNETIANIKTDAEDMDIAASLTQIEKRQLDVIMSTAEDRPFTKFAYDRTVNQFYVETKLQNEFMQSALLGEGRKKLLERIQKVTGFEAKRCKTIAQTEHTRIQSEARYAAGQDAADAGVMVANEWSCKMMDTSRETHKDLDGMYAMQGEMFKLSDGDELRFPGDPMGRACNTINCYCVLIPHVLLKGERIAADGRGIIRGRK